MEQELMGMLAEQRTALVELKAVLQFDGDNQELVGLCDDLQASAADTEAALLKLKQDALLERVSRLQDTGLAPNNGQPAPTEATPNSPAPGSRHAFRHTDGRWHVGEVTQTARQGLISLRFATPTSTHMLTDVQVPVTALRPVRSSSSEHLHYGTHVLALLPGRQLWQLAEVVHIREQDQQVVLVTSSSSERHVVAGEFVAEVVRPAEQRSQDSRDSGSAVELRESLSSASDSADSDASDDGNSTDEFVDSSALEGGSIAGGLLNARSVDDLAAAAGPQTDTVCFAGWEQHTRGIGSKLMAGMGYVRGSGLGVSGAGMSESLHAVRLKPGAGLGVDAGNMGTKERNRKKTRGGEQARRKKKAAAEQQALDAKRDAQSRLEAEQGVPGLFAFMNSKLGDRAAPSMTDQNASSSRPRHFPVGGAQATTSSTSAGKHAARTTNRGHLIQQQEQLTAMRQKVTQLQQMAARNAKNKVMLPQIQQKLAESQANLHAAEQHHAFSQKSLSDSDNQKRWMKF